MGKSVFSYKDYRKFLSSLYRQKKAGTNYFSYEYIAMKSGIKSRSYIYRIMKGERSLSISSCLKLSKALDLTPLEAEYFFNLVCLNQASSDVEKDFFSDKLEVLRKQNIPVGA